MVVCVLATLILEICGRRCRVGAGLETGRGTAFRAAHVRYGAGLTFECPLTSSFGENLDTSVAGSPIART